MHHWICITVLPKVNVFRLLGQFWSGFSLAGWSGRRVPGGAVSAVGVPAPRLRAGPSGEEQAAPPLPGKASAFPAERTVSSASALAAGWVVFVTVPLWAQEVILYKKSFCNPISTNHCHSYHNKRQMQYIRFMFLLFFCHSLHVFSI